MDTLVYQNQLELLGHDLQKGLHAAFEEARLLVRCGRRHQQLLVLVQHPANVPLPEPEVFGTLEALLYRAEALGYLTEFKSDEAVVLPVRLFLRFTGHKQPYATQALQLDVQRVTQPFDRAASSAWAAASGAAASDSWAYGESPSDGSEAIPEDVALGSGATEPTPRIDSEDEAIAQSYSPYSSADDIPPRAIPFTTRLADFATEPEMEPQAATTVRPRRRRGFSSSLASAGLAAAVLTGGIGGYALSRPCVIGECVPLQTAQQLNFEAAQTIDSPASAQDVVNAYDQIMESIYWLSTIPAWSSHYDDAQALIQVYGDNASVLERVVLAQRFAWSAAEKSQDPPHPLVAWREIQQLWQEAIAQLRQVQTDNPVYDLARTKLEEYEANLTMIERRIRIEIQAQDRVKEARQVAKVAEAQDGIAIAVNSLREATATWQTAVSYLADVPRTTMAHAEAQQLLALYGPQLETVRRRLMEEEVAAAAYDRALAFAAEAQQAEQRDQWSQAIGQWQQALGQVESAPANTSQFSQMQPLVPAYRAAIERAQSQLANSMTMQTVQADLESICGGATPICTHRPTAQGVEVRMTDAYRNALEQATSQQTGAGWGTVDTTSPTYSSVRMGQMNPLLRAIAAVGKTSGLPIELYNADGSLFGVYDPDVEGYVPSLTQ
ncbi:MAG: hypothetical protein KME20_09280 [Kaiparowitsia implicata GSE-PSE-MK54-09C]|jgi:tetratricopeptide (TPR) repeat protein|nr:hypothetical protein [Kaiparowitsia implicata GSE-PSE-MK54-09C]